MISAGEDNMLVPDFWPESLATSEDDFDLHPTQTIIQKGIEENFTVISTWHTCQVNHLLFTPGAILWCDPCKELFLL